MITQALLAGAAAVAFIVASSGAILLFLSLGAAAMRFLSAAIGLGTEVKRRKKGR